MDEGKEATPGESPAEPSDDTQQAALPALAMQQAMTPTFVGFNTQQYPVNFFNNGFYFAPQRNGRHSAPTLPTPEMNPFAMAAPGPAAAHMALGGPSNQVVNVGEHL